MLKSTYTRPISVMNDWLSMYFTACSCHPCCVKDRNLDCWRLKVQGCFDQERRLFQYVAILSKYSLYVFSAVVCSSEVVSLLARSDPLGYFHLLELLCRMAPWDTWGQDFCVLLGQGDSFRALHWLYLLLTSAVVDLKGSVPSEADQGKQQQQHGPWWQYWKAAASTYASWTKAYAKTLRAVARGRAAAIKQMAAAGRAAQQSGAEKKMAQEAAAADGAARGAAAGWVDSHHDEWLDVLSSQLSKTPSPAGRDIISPAAVGADRVRLELLLLLWRARVVAVTAEHLVTGPATAAAGIIGSGEANLTTGSTEGASKASNSRRRSTPTTQCSGVSTAGDEADFGSSTSGGGKVEEGVGVSPVAPSSAIHAVVDPAGSSAAEQDALERLGGLDAALELAVAFYNEVYAWTERAAEVQAAAETAGSKALDNDERLLSQRLVHVPTSLPPSVASHLEHIYRSYMEKVCNSGKELLVRERQQWKLQLLQDVLRLCELLLVEVPCTIGCSNPACVDLRGASEVKVSCKACTGCKVVHYCSRQCQVAHWKVHKGICKELLGGNPGGGESKKGGGKQRAAGEVTSTI